MNGRLSSFSLTFMRQAGATYATRLAGVLIGLATAVAVSRALGPEGRGSFAAAMAIAALGVSISNLGVSTSNTYHAAKDPRLVGRLIGNSLIASAAFGSLTILAFGILKAGFGAFSELDNVLFLAALAWIPVGACFLLLTAIALGIRRITLLNLAELALRTLTLGLIAVALFAIGLRTAEGVFLTALSVQIGVTVFVLLALRKVESGRIGFSPKLLLSQIPFALKSYIALLGAFMLVRIDLLMVQEIAGNAETGYYSIAVSIADIIYILPAVISQIIFPHLSANPDPRKRLTMTGKLLGHVGWIMALVGGGMWLASPLAVRILFGEAFMPSVPMLRILILAVYAYGLNGILSNYLIAEGLPWPAVWVWVAAVALNVALNLVWIPEYGGVGAAYASLVSYVAVLAFQGAMLASRARKQNAS